MSIVIASLNGADGVRRCLDAVAAQSIAADIEVVVVDDGSTDGTGDAAGAKGARVVRHGHNRGLAAARNSGIAATTAPVVAFLDDDVEPGDSWAARILAGYGEDGVLGVGGPVHSVSGASYMGRFLERHNPLEPLEIELAESERLSYRLRLYLADQLVRRPRHGRRPVFALVGANMSFRRDALEAVGGFDERFTFGHEELDVCRRIALAFPDERFLLEPTASIEHHFVDSFSDTFRRARSYGRGSARMYRKWPSSRPTVFPLPLLVGVLALAAPRRRVAGLAAMLAPPALFSGCVQEAARTRRVEHLLDPYLKLAQETAGDIGFLEGLWRFRGLEREADERTVSRRPADHPALEEVAL